MTTTDMRKWINLMENSNYQEQGIDSNLVDPTPLFDAIKANDYDKVDEIIFDSEINLNVKNSMGETPLFKAIACNADSEIVSLLINHGADVNKNVEFFSGIPTILLHAAIDFPVDVETIRVIIDAVNDIDAKDAEGRTALHRALYTKRPENEQFDIIDELVSAGANVNIKDDYGKTPYDIVENKYNSSKRTVTMRIIKRLKDAGGVGAPRQTIPDYLRDI